MREIVYTDGGCIGNPGPGAWAFFLPEKDIARSGFEANTTNNRMELIAVIQALEFVDSTSELVLHLDSQYVRQGITKWIFTWERNNWKNSAKKPIKNRDLWEALRTLTRNRNIQWELVPSHSGVAGNERCHELVQSTIRQSIRS